MISVFQYYFTAESYGILYVCPTTNGNGGGYDIDVYETETGEMLFSMTTTVTLPSDPQSFEPFTEFAFTADGEYAVGVTENSFVVADLLKNETRLIERAEMITSLYREE